ncbi:MAG: Ppx/GppA family phosphatase, partial [Synergistaceae bacterium]|nr:Ppx/GppA family phosphatase [Synergistaceae bacterium]
MIKAVIDIGTNSIKLCIAKIVNGEIFILKDINKITKLGEGLQKDGSLGKEAIERTLLEAVNYVQMAKA